MQKSYRKIEDNLKHLSKISSNRNATNPLFEIREIHHQITNEQIAVLEEAIEQYRRLEEVKKYTALVLKDFEEETEEDFELTARELEEKIKDQKDFDIESLLSSENFLKDLYKDGFDN